MAAPGWLDFAQAPPCAHPACRSPTVQAKNGPHPCRGWRRQECTPRLAAAAGMRALAGFISFVFGVRVATFDQGDETRPADDFANCRKDQKPTKLPKRNSLTRKESLTAPLEHRHRACTRRLAQPRKTPAILQAHKKTCPRQKSHCAVPPRRQGPSEFALATNIDIITTSEINRAPFARPARCRQKCLVIKHEKYLTPRFFSVYSISAGGPPGEGSPPPSPPAGHFYYY